jgi:cellobiose phosphorylase
MKFGYFDDASREYVITQPNTPLPWINYLGSEAYFGLISNTAGGYSFYKDARLRRLTRYRYNNAPLDMGGRYLYLRDNQTGRYWSPTWMPTRTPLDEYECRHGQGYTIITSKLNGIKSSTRYFVPLGESLEIWQVTLTNESASNVDLSLFSAIEFCLWDANDDATNFQRNYSIGQVEIARLALDGREDGGEGDGVTVIYHKTEYRERRDHFAYFACSEKLAGFDTIREEFLGSYRGWHEPAVVEQGESCNSVAYGWQPIGSQHVKVPLRPGEQKQVIFLLGYQENPKDDKFDPPGSQVINKKRAKQALEKYLQPANADKAFNDLRDYWTMLLGKLQVMTPDEHTNRMVNIWNAYQCMMTFTMSRSASYFESGIGRGMGFRDSNQDLLGFVHMIPERARERILDVSATQLNNGGAFHQYQPLTKRGNNDVGSGFNDDPLWLVLAVAAYLKESGDWSILAEQVPYENEPETESPLYEHLQRCIQYTIDRLGPNNLPLIGHADWNDCLNLNCFSDTPGQSFQTTATRDGKVAESVLIAGLFVLACKEMIEISRKWQVESDTFHSPLSISDMEAAIARMEATIWKSGWDGEWFRRAYDDFGHVLGSKENTEGKIFIEPQGICIMAGLGLDAAPGNGGGKAIKALDSVATHLATPHGIVLQQPAFSQYYLHLGEISSYPPGYKENASVFCHTNPWIMIAEAMVGRGDKAFDYYTRINPSARESISELHKCEPYVYAQTIAGRDAATPGEAKNSWLSGTAAWNYVAITQHILGIRPTWEGLEISPVIPASWDGFTATREYRGAAYQITVTNPKHISQGVKKVLVNGEQIEGSLIRADAHAASGEVRVEVVMG